MTVLLAAAIEADAELILTFNLKDFPEDELAKHGIKAIHPDDFLVQLIEKDPDNVLDAFEQQLARLRNPPLTREYVLDKLTGCGLPQTAASLRLPAGDIGAISFSNIY